MTDTPETAAEDTAAPEAEAQDGPDPSTMTDAEQTEYYRSLAVKGKERAEKEGGGKPKPPAADEGKGGASDAKEPEKAKEGGKADSKGKDVDDKKAADNSDKGGKKAVDDKKAADNGDKDDSKGDDGDKDDGGAKPDHSKPPQNISKAVKEAWEKIPEDARAEIAKAHAESNTAKMQLGREQAKVKAAAEKAQPAVELQDAIVNAVPEAEAYIKEHGHEKFAAAVTSALAVDAAFADDPIAVIFNLAKGAGVLGDFKEALKDVDVQPSGKGTNLGREGAGGQGDANGALVKQIDDLKKQVKSLQERDYAQETAVANHKNAYQAALDHAEANTPGWDDSAKTAVAHILPEVARLNPSATEAEHVQLAINSVAKMHPTLQGTSTPADTAADAAQKAAKAAEATGTNVNPAGTGPATEKEADLSENDEIRAIVAKHYPNHNLTIRD